MDIKNGYRWLLIIVVALTATAPRLFMLDIPFDRDEGAYAYIADIIDRGGLPYRDAFDHKPPGVYYIYYLSFRLLGHSVSSPRLVAAIFLLVTCVLLFQLVQRMTKNLSAGAFATVLLGLASISPAYTGFSSNTEIFTLPFIIGGVLFMNDDDPAPLKYLWSGLLFGAALMVKQPVISIALACMVGSMWLHPRKLIANTVLFITGLFIPFAIFAAYFALNGCLTEFWKDCFDYNFGYIAGPTAYQSIVLLKKSMESNLWLDPYTWVAGGIGFLLYLVLGEKGARKVLFIAALSGAVAATAMGKYFYGHYFIFILPFLCAAAGLGAARFLNGRLRPFVIGLLLLVVGAGVVQTCLFLARPANERLMISFGSNPFQQSVDVGVYLRRHADRNATAYVIGSEPQIFFHSGLHAPTRYFYFYPLMSQTRYQAAFRVEVLAELRQNPPDYLILVNHLRSHSIKEPHGDPFLVKLFSFFAQYKLAAFSRYGEADVIMDGAALWNRQLLTEPGSLLVFRRPNGTDLNARLSLGTITGF